MSGTGSVTLAWNLSGGPDGARTGGPATISISSAVNETLPVALTNGNTTVSVPSGATVAIILPPNYTTPGVPTPNPAYGGTLTLKGVSGDTGVAISNKWPYFLAFDTAPASFVVAATASGTLTVVFA